MNGGRPRLILGSGSPRRLDILAQIGVRPDEIRAPDIDETPLAGELPRAYCARVTTAKAQAIERQFGEIVLAADTTVALGRRILGKPADAGEAAHFLTLLGGRRHSVLTAVAVMSDRGLHLRTVQSAVKMKRLSDQELNFYLQSYDWQGKAGGYAIQGPAGAFVSWISGSYTAVMGLPAYETAILLGSAGYPVFGAVE